MARVSIVNNLGNTIYDKFVRPQENIVGKETPKHYFCFFVIENIIDFRTKYSGVRYEDVANAPGLKFLNQIRFSRQFFEKKKN